MIHHNEHSLPKTLELEAAVLGALINEAEMMTQIVSILEPEHFSDPTNVAIYRVMQDMYDANEQIDFYTVVNRCKTVEALKQSKIAVLLSGYTQKVGSGAHAMKHALIVKEHYIRRKMIEASLRISGMASDQGTDLVEALDTFSQLADQCNDVAAGGTTAKPVAKIVETALKHAENRCSLRQSGQFPGIPTGLSELDRLTGGWHSSQLIVIAARPAMGKTAFMLHLAKSAALFGMPVCIYSLEMADVSLADRLLLSETSIDPDRFRRGELESNEWKQLEEASAILQGLPIYIDDNPTVSMRYIKVRSKLMQKRGKCGMVIIDYLQLADTATDRKNSNREQEIANASRQAKIIAKELGVPVILLSQLSRRVEERVDKMPLLSDLRESGAIEQDADVVGFIYRPAYYKQETIKTLSQGEISTKGVGILSIAKQRDGATGMVLFSHNPSLTKLGDYGQNLDTNPYY